MKHRPTSPLAPPAVAFANRHARRCGFTLIELMVVIVIIITLISILIPVIGKVHQSAYETLTRNEISEISGACDQYFNDWKAYPGPVSNTDIDAQILPLTLKATAGNSLPAQRQEININGANAIYQSSSGGMTPITTLNPPQTGTGYFTASENLTLGLLGGLWINPNTGSENGKLEFVNGPSGAATGVPPTLVGTGPQTLLPSSFTSGSVTTANPSFKQFGSYLQVSFPGSPFLLNGDGSPQDGLTAYHDAAGNIAGCVVPVFVDQFPDHMPLIYLRARVGARGILSDGTIPDPLAGNNVNTPAIYNYDLREVVPYTVAPVAGKCIGVPQNGGGIIGEPGQHGLQASGVGKNLYYDPPPHSATNPLPIGYNFPVPTQGAIGQANAAQYFMNLSIQPTNITTAALIDSSGTPRQKDQFIIISAGRDRTYGTGDDVDNFGDVEP